MGLNKGFAGLYTLLMVLLIIITWAYVQTVKTSNEYSEITAREIHLDKISMTKNVILYTYKKVSPENRLAWAQHVQEQLAPKNGLQATIDFSNTPYKATLYNPTLGYKTQFYLT